MDLFVLDTEGDNDLLKKSAKNSLKRALIDGDTIFNESVEETEYTENEKVHDLPPERTELLNFLKGAIASCTAKNKTKKPKTNLVWSSDDDDNFARPNLEEIKKNALKAIEKKDKLEQPSARQLAKMRKAERAKTKGKDWFNMPAPEITEELENDLKVLQMRSILDPKHFYKRNSMKTLPKYFQVGTVQHSAIDYFSERNERKNKKRSLVEELLADADFQKYNKRKYKEVMEKRRKTGYHKANQKMKKLKKKKK